MCFGSSKYLVNIFKISLYLFPGSFQSCFLAIIILVYSCKKLPLMAAALHRLRLIKNALHCCSLLEGKTYSVRAGNYICIFDTVIVLFQFKIFIKNQAPAPAFTPASNAAKPWVMWVIYIFSSEAKFGM